MFKFKFSDIKKEKGNYVVNPSNTVLSLGNGVSGVLKMMCPELQNVMWEYLNRNGFLNPGDIAITPYPCSEFKYAIHAAVMDYRENALKIEPDFKRIEMICKKIAFLLNNKDVKVITPLLGTGIGGLDKEKVFKIMKRYFLPIKAEVILIIHNKKDYEKLIKI